MRLLSLLALGLLLQAPPALEPGFTSLWNGKDFTDWQVNIPDSFTIQDGAMVANVKTLPGHAFYTGPFRNHSFRNFELKVDVMTRPSANGGIFIMTEYLPKGWPAKGFEVQVNNSYVKDPVKTGSLYHVLDVKEALPKDDVWFTEHIIVNGNTITIKVNDVQTVTWTQPADWNGTSDFVGRRLAPGTIGLQAHDPNSTVFYRNIRIKPLE